MLIGMRTAFVLLVHLVVSIAKLLGPGGVRGLLAESLLLKHQLLIQTRSRKRAPNLSVWDRFLLGLWCLVIKPARIAKNAVAVRPSTLFALHDATMSAALPKRLSSDNDPLFLFHRWKANLRVLGVEEIKTVPYVPISHPFVERLIGSIRRELLDQAFFWNAVDLERKLGEYQAYFNGCRTHAGIDGMTPAARCGGAPAPIASLGDYRWQQHCRGLFELPIAA